MAKHGGVKDKGEYFVISPTTRKVTVPHAHKYIGTVGDHLSEQITFECPQIIDGHDVSQCERKYITWVNVQGDIGHDELKITEVEQPTADNIYLAWDVRNTLTVAKGVVQFSVHFEDVDSNGVTAYRWSTASCKDCEILDSINAVLGKYKAIYVAGNALVISDYTPVTDNTLELESNGIIPEGTITIDKNGSHPVGEYAEAIVNVEGDVPTLEISESGTVTARSSFGTIEDQLSVDHDSNFKPENIRNGVTIFGVTGTYGSSGDSWFD